jgi:hypothetical protein
LIAGSYIAKKGLIESIRPFFYAKTAGSAIKTGVSSYWIDSVHRLKEIQGFHRKGAMMQRTQRNSNCYFWISLCELCTFAPLRWKLFSAFKSQLT